MYKELKKIWKDIFNDSDEYIELFFSRKVKPENTYVIYEDGKIVSMLFAVCEKINGYNAAYICGVATLPQYRGKGLGAKLIATAESDLKNRGFDICFLIPADKELFGFYNTKGYKTRFYLSERTLAGGKNLHLNSFSEEFDYELMNKFYNEINCKNKPERDYENFKDIFDCYENLRIYENGYLLWYKEDGKIKIVEHTLSNIDECAFQLLYDTGLETAEILSPAKENPIPFAMMKILNKKISENEFSDIYDNYVNLMLN